MYIDTHSVNLSQDAEEVCAIYQTVIVPVSAGTPQEMSFAESRGVITLKSHLGQKLL
jgi:hypothetical protein